MKGNRVKRPPAKKRVNKSTVNITLVNSIDEYIIRKDCGISCGIRELGNVARAYIITKENNRCSEADLVDAFKYYFKNRNRGMRSNIRLVSLNDGAPKPLIDLLDNITTVKSEWVLNKNSGNKIKI